jgi:hypothetical protein
MPSDEAIIEAMVGSECPWENMNHHLSFLPTLDESKTSTSYNPNFQKEKFHSSTTHIFLEGYLATISPKMDMTFF